MKVPMKANNSSMSTSVPHDRGIARENRAKLKKKQSSNFSTYRIKDI